MEKLEESILMFSNYKISYKMPLNYKAHPSHMLVENIELTVTSIADGGIISN